MKKNKQKELKINRRELLAGSASLGAIALSSKIGYSKETNPNNLPPNVPEWTGELGEGVDANDGRSRVDLAAMAADFATTLATA